MAEYPQETLLDREVTYALELGDRFIIVENVPARVCVETGEKFFAPATVEKLQKLAWERRAPDRVIQTPVYRFAA